MDTHNMIRLAPRIVSLMLLVGWCLGASGSLFAQENARVYGFVGSHEIPPELGVGEPIDIAIDDEGAVFVGDQAAMVLRVLDANGNQVHLLGGGEEPISMYNGRICERDELISVAIDRGGEAAERTSRVFSNRTCARGGPLLPGSEAILLETDLNDLSKSNVLDPLRLPVRKRFAIDPSDGNIVANVGNYIHSINPNSGKIKNSSRLPIDVQPGDTPQDIVVLKDLRFAYINSALELIQIAGFDDDTEGFILRYPNIRPVALANYRPDMFVALLQSTNGDERAPMVMLVDAEGDVVNSWSSEDLGAPMIPQGSNWPWAISASEHGFAFITAGSSFLAASYHWDGSNALRMKGRAYRNWSAAKDARSFTEDTRADFVRGEEIAILDRNSGSAIRWHLSDGRADYFTAPEYANDLASDQQSVYVTTEDNSIWRIEASTGISKSISPSDYQGDQRGEGGIALHGNELFVGWPSQREIGVLDIAADLTALGGLDNETARSLWPTDIVSNGDGKLYVANAGRARMEIWDSRAPFSKLEEWRSGLIFGPFRISAGEWDGEKKIIGSLSLDDSVELLDQENGKLLHRFQLRRRPAESARYTDLVLGNDGRVFVFNSLNQWVDEYGLIQSTPTETPAPPETPDCLLSGDKWVAPEEIVLGETADITLTLRAECLEQQSIVGADIVLLVDRSKSFAGVFGAMVEALTGFTERLDNRYHRISVVSFSADVSVDHGFDEDTRLIRERLDSLPVGGGTNIALGIDRADRLLLESAREGALPVVVLVSDGEVSRAMNPPGPRFPDPVPAAERMRNRGATVYSIGYGNVDHEDVLVRIAGSDRNYFYAPSEAMLVSIYRRLVELLQFSLTGRVSVIDEMADDVPYISRSSEPSALESTGVLMWGVPIIPKNGITMTYTIRPSRLGYVPTNKTADASVVTNEGDRYHFQYPVPYINVISPTPSPTPTPTLTPSPTTGPDIRKLFLPLLLSESCKGLVVSSDVVIAIDASSSMLNIIDGRRRIDIVVEAAGELVGRLELESGDQASIVSFNRFAQTHQTLTNHQPAIFSALRDVTIDNGSRIDLGISAAQLELQSGRQRPANRKVIVLLSDGKASPEPIETAFSAARDAKNEGSQIYVLGLGDNVNNIALQEISSGPEFLFLTRDSKGLAAAYTSIAQQIDCPAELLWGKR